MAGTAKLSALTNNVNNWRWRWFKGLGTGTPMTYFYELVREGKLSKKLGNELPAPAKYRVVGPDKLSNYFGLSLKGFIDYNKANGEEADNMKYDLFQWIFTYKSGSIESRHSLRDILSRYKWNAPDKDFYEKLRAAIV